VNPGGVVLLIAGTWIACQLWRGEALERLGVIGAEG
jgi:hypothetical protein